MGVFTRIKQRSISPPNDDFRFDRDDFQFHPEDRGLNGQTIFFRQPLFQSSLIQYLSETLAPRSNLRILIAPGSIGCEAATLAALAATNDNLMARHGAVSIHTLDISYKFTQIAQQGFYPGESLNRLPDKLKTCFQNADARGYKQLIPQIQKTITVLPSSSIRNFKPSEPYDVVLSFNFLLYVGEERAAYIRNLAALTRHMLCLNHLTPHPEIEASPMRSALRQAGMQFADHNWVVRSPSGYDELQEIRDKRDGVSVYLKHASI